MDSFSKEKAKEEKVFKNRKDYFEK